MHPRICLEVTIVGNVPISLLELQKLPRYGRDAEISSVLHKYIRPESVDAKRFAGKFICNVTGTKIGISVNHSTAILLVIEI